MSRGSSTTPLVVERILAKRIRVEYLVQWRGLAPTESTWEAEEDISPVIVKLFDTGSSLTELTPPRRRPLQSLDGVAEGLGLDMAAVERQVAASEASSSSTTATSSSSASSSAAYSAPAHTPHRASAGVTAPGSRKRKLSPTAQGRGGSSKMANRGKKGGSGGKKGGSGGKGGKGVAAAAAGAAAKGLSSAKPSRVGAVVGGGAGDPEYSYYYSEYEYEEVFEEE